MEISWTDRVRNEEMLQRVKGERNVVKWKVWRIIEWPHLAWELTLKRVIEGKIEGRIEVKGSLWGICKQLLDELREKRCYWKSKEDAQESTVRRTGFGRVCGPIVRQTIEWMNECELS
jgi:hypothetical protein